MRMHVNHITFCLYTICTVYNKIHVQEDQWSCKRSPEIHTNKLRWRRVLKGFYGRYYLPLNVFTASKGSNFYILIRTIYMYGHGGHLRHVTWIIHEYICSLFIQMSSSFRDDLKILWLYSCNFPGVCALTSTPGVQSFSES